MNLNNVAQHVVASFGALLATVLIVSVAAGPVVA